MTAKQVQCMQAICGDVDRPEFVSWYLFALCRLLHYRLLYKHVHKIHHEWTAPTGIVSVYSHPVEFVLVNLIPITLGPIVMGSHLIMVWVWFSFVILNTTVEHCGYHLPFLPSSELHDFHHRM